jgi:hypothetical protein
MNRKQYNSDTRYEKVLHNMDLLGIIDITTTRQHKNGTVVWRLPIKNNHKPTSFIEVASFKTGYVRNQNSGYSNYQLNKRCLSEPQYYPEYKWCNDKDCNIKTGKYQMFQTRACKLIPIEIDRLEYLMSYCLKNYFIKHANFVVDGKYVNQQYHDFRIEQERKNVNNCGYHDRINDLEEKLDAMTDANGVLSTEVDCMKNKLSNAITPTKYQCVKNKLHDLENKLATIKRIADYDTK